MNHYGKTSMQDEKRKLSREPGAAHFPGNQDMTVMNTLRDVSTCVSIFKQTIKIFKRIRR